MLILRSFTLKLSILYANFVEKQDKVNNADSAFIFFDNSKSKSMARLVRSEKMALSGLVFARKIARMILIQNI